MIQLDSIGPMLGSPDVLIPTFDIILEHQGHKMTVTGGLDSGAEPIAVVSDSIANQLGLPRLGKVDVHGVGTGRGSLSRIDSIRLADMPNCALQRAQILIFTTQGPIDVLLGDGFLRAVNGTLEFSDAGHGLVCKGQSLFSLSLTEPAVIIPIGIGALALGFGLAAILGAFK